MFVCLFYCSVVLGVGLVHAGHILGCYSASVQYHPTLILFRARGMGTVYRGLVDVGVRARQAVTGVPDLPVCADQHLWTPDSVIVEAQRLRLCLFAYHVRNGISLL